MAENVVVPITDMCYQMISEANFPNIFKYADVKPIYKKGDRDSSSNYRPITILYNLSKIFERVLLSICRMTNFIDKHSFYLIINFL